MNITQIILQGIRNPALPITITCADATKIQCTLLLRLLPKKRAVFKGTMSGKTVIVKVFSDAAKQQYHKELNNANALLNSPLRIPSLIKHSKMQTTATSKHYNILVFEFFEEPPLDQLWQRSCYQKKRELLIEVLQEIANMHNAGIIQLDLHLGNFIKTPQGIISLDLAEIKIDNRQGCNNISSVKNLALFIAQFNLLEQRLVTSLVNDYYWQFRNIKGSSLELLYSFLNQAWEKRRNHYIKKLRRDSSQYYFKKTNTQLVAYPRKNNCADLQSFLNQPLEWIEDATILKNGNSCKVVRQRFGGQDVVIKAYRYKSIDRWLRRSWRKSRAQKNWEYAHYLSFAGINTPRPIALLEKRIGPITTQAYYVCELIMGQNLTEFITTYDTFTQEILTQLRNIFYILQKEKIVHGDFKASNLIFEHINNNSTNQTYDQQEPKQLHLIDLDGIKQVRSELFWQQLKDKDAKRLLANWRGKPAILEQLSSILPNY